MIKNFPLSGDVSQMFNPWMIWLKSLSQQSGLININNFKSNDRELEQKIVEEVAGYGKQIGYINNILKILADRIKPENLTPEQRQSFDNFREMVDKIDEAKREHKLSLQSIDRTINEIKALKDKDEKAYNEIVSRIRNAFLQD